MMTLAPIRMCVACRRRRPKQELVRLVRTVQRPDGPACDTIVDRRGRLPGRGAYVCPEAGCLDASTRRGGASVRRALRGGDPDAVVTALATVKRDLTTGAGADSAGTAGLPGK